MICYNIKTTAIKLPQEGKLQPEMNVDHSWRPTLHTCANFLPLSPGSWPLYITMVRLRSEMWNQCWHVKNIVYKMLLFCLKLIAKINIINILSFVGIIIFMTASLSRNYLCEDALMHVWITWKACYGRVVGQENKNSTSGEKWRAKTFWINLSSTIDTDLLIND